MHHVMQRINNFVWWPVDIFHAILMIGKIEIKKVSVILGRCKANKVAYFLALNKNGPAY